MPTIFVRFPARFLDFIRRSRFFFETERGARERAKLQLRENRESANNRAHLIGKRGEPAMCGSVPTIKREGRAARTLKGKIRAEDL